MRASPKAVCLERNLQQITALSAVGNVEFLGMATETLSILLTQFVVLFLCAFRKLFCGIQAL